MGRLIRTSHCSPSEKEEYLDNLSRLHNVLFTIMESNGDSDNKAAAKNETPAPNVHLSKHPVLSHKITLMRSTSTDTGTFRSLLREVTYHLGYEATAHMTTREIPVTVKIGKEKTEEHLDAMGVKLKEQVALVPILRSGLGMCDSMLELLPKSSVYHIGMYRIPGHAPVQYFNRLPKDCQSDIAYLLDPVIASASTVMAVIAILKKVRWFDS